MTPSTSARRMNLGVKVGGIVLGAFLLAIGIGHAIQLRLILPSFYELEREEAGKNLERVVATLQGDLTQVGLSSADWAQWDDMYTFVGGRGDDATFLETTLNENALETMQVELLAVYDPDGRRIWGATLDPATLERLDLGELSADALPADHRILRGRLSTEGVTGLWATPAGVLLVGARAVLRSDRSGTAAGTFVVGRLLDTEAVEVIAARTRLEPRFEPLASVGATATADPSATTLERTAQGVEARTFLTDLAGRAVVKVSVTTPPDISARGERAVDAALASSAASVLAVLLLLLATLNRQVVAPLENLTRHAIRVGQSDDLRTRLSLQRRDEIGVLAGAFDRMTDRLSETRRELMAQSFASGKAELASGVLHNVGNVVTPLVVRLVDLQDALKAAPAAELRAAAAELGRPGDADDRRRDLARFVQLAGAQLANLTLRTREELAAITQHVHHVQRILGDQERHSRSTQVVERIDLAELVREGIDMLSPTMRASFASELDDGLTAAGGVLGSRIALQQVVSNLLINAAEAIAARGGGPGRLRIDAVPGPAGRDLVDVRFADDGVGLDPEELQRVFERGFSTKGRRGSGLGLHWCAVTVQALGGHLRAESPGRGRGCTMHLVLPAAPDAAAGG